MKIKNNLLNWYFLLFMVVFTGIGNAQEEVLLPLTINPSLLKSEHEKSSEKQLKTANNDTITLPFFDDFSNSNPYPDDSKWLNSNSVFINRTYAKNPLTIGVATFDGLKANGYPYRPFVNSGSSNADTLTSKVIRLDSLNFPPLAISPEDSVYLSFYYQPKGFGHAPLNSHTLMLDFYNPTTKSWSTVLSLSRNGVSAKDSVFTRVMIPITAPEYFKKEFQFRFRNKNTGSGGVNHWHIDQVYLGKDRSKNDTSFSDLAFVYPAQSLLKNYSAMPYNQYSGENDMAEHSYLTIRNNDQYATNFTGFIRIQDSKNTFSLYDTTGSDNAQPFFAGGYVSNPDIIDFLNSSVSPDISTFAFNSGNPFRDSISYNVTHFLKTSAGDWNKNNDTLLFRQKFHNYFSYDDGSAELAWGLQGTYGAETAIQFQLTKPDTLRALDIFFNPVNNVPAISNLYFGLRVWNDGGGTPGTLVYDDANTMLRQPVYYTWGNTNAFVRYPLKYPLVLNEGVFYVGIKQDDIQSLNIGFDQNTNNQNKLFYNTDGKWENSSFKGSLLLRPIFGDSLAAIGIRGVSSKKQDVQIYPNPANETIYFQKTGELKITHFVLHDSSGKTISFLQNNADKPINITRFEEGFYLLKVFSGTELLSVQKLIISRP